MVEDKLLTIRVTRRCVDIAKELVRNDPITFPSIKNTFDKSIVFLKKKVDKANKDDKN